MKKVSFGAKKFDFIFESQEEIKKILRGEKLKVPLNNDLSEFAVFRLDKSGNKINNNFYVKNFPEEKIFYLEFLSKCLGGFLTKKYHHLNFYDFIEKIDFSVYAPGSYDNKDYLSQ